MTTDYIGQQLGSYRLLHLLGRGGFADVYLGEHIHLKSLAAIKVLYTRLADELEESFLNEARILARLAHPHIIRILDYGIQGGVPFLVMEYAPHGTLRQRHPPNARLDLTTVVDYVRQIADGLQYAHDQKLIHRDLKPENLLIGQRDELLLSDFGVALIAQTTRTNDNDSANVLAGTAAYMAPEQLQGRPVFASDQYSLGVMVYEWLCGTRPFQGTFLEIYSQHMSVPPAPMREHAALIPPAVEEVVQTALAKDPGKRFASVKAFATAFEQSSQPSLSFSTQFLQSFSGPPATGPQLAFPGSDAIPPQPAGQAALAQSAPPTSNPDTARPATLATELPEAAPSGNASVKSGIISAFPFPIPTRPTIASSMSTLTPQPGMRQPLSRGMTTSLRGRFFHRKTALIAGLALLLVLAVLGANFAFVFAFNGGHRGGSSTPTGSSVQTARNGGTATPIVVAGAGRSPIASATSSHGMPTAPVATPTTASSALPTATPTSMPKEPPTPTPTPPPGGPTLVYSSSLSSQDGASWDVFNYSGGGGCGFSGGAYHATMPQTGHVAICTAEGSNVTNFIYQVQMTVLEGDGGGLLFRSNSSGFYRFRVGTDGTYDLVNQTVGLVNGSSPAIRTGAGQANILKVVAQGNAISLYVNGQLLTTVYNSASSYGKFGVFGVDFANSTDAAFSNARVWQV